MKSTSEILQPVFIEAKDHFFLTPMTAEEISKIAAATGLEMPAQLQELLACVGLRQDFLKGKYTGLQFFRFPESFKSTRDFLLENFGEAATEMFPFADDGAGNVICLRSSSQGDNWMYFADHEVLEIDTYKPWSGWLEEVVSKALTDQHRVRNTDKEWAVQFSFSADNFESITAVISGMADFRDLDCEWKDREISPANVTSFKRRVTINGQSLVFGKLEYDGWPMPRISLTMREPALTSPEHSLIRRLDSAFDAAGFERYALVDYGILPRSDAPS